MNENNYLKRFTRGIGIIDEMTYPYRYNNTDKILNKQNKLINEILSYAVKHCEYYKKLGIEELKLLNFPLLTKQIIRDNFDTVISDEKDQFIYWDAYTGGSTGEPLHFLQQSCIDLPYQIYLWRRMGWKPGDVIVAMSGSKVPEEKLSNNIFWVQENRYDIPYGRMEISSLYYNPETAPYYIDYLNSIKPSYIRGYPSFVYDVSRYILDNNISLDFIPKAIQLTSESSYNYQYDAIKKAFRTNCIVLQYGHTESCAFAYTYDSTYEYVVEPLYGMVEILDDSGNEVSEGDMGEIVVTSYYNRVMPLIRYKTGDIAVKGKCIDGKLHLTRIMGRTQDYIIDRMGNKVLLTALIFGQHFKALGKIAKWQIEQLKAGVITIHIVRTPTYRDSDEAEISRLFDAIGNVDTIFDYVTSIPPTPRGKSLMLVQRVQDSFNS